MNPFERGRHGKLLTEAERRSRSGVVWPQGSTASDAVYPLLHEIASQPPEGVVYPLLSELNPQPSSDVVYPLLHELRPQPPDDVVYLQMPNESRRWPSPVAFPIVHDAVYPFAYMNSPVQRHLPTTVSPTTGEVYPFAYMIAAEQNNPALRSLAAPPSQGHLPGHPLTRSHPLSPNVAARSSPGMGTLLESTASSWPTTAAETNTSSGPRHSLLESVAPSFPLSTPFGKSLHSGVATQTGSHLISYFQYPDFEPENSEEAFIRSSNLHEALSRLSKQTSLFGLLNHSNPRSLLDKYLHSNPSVVDAMLFPPQETSSLEQRSLVYSPPVLLAYPTWETGLKDRLAYFFITLLEVWRELIKTKSAKHVTLAKAFPIDPDQPTFSWHEARDIFLAYVAHSLLVEIAELVPWRLHWYSRESLVHLFSAEHTIINITNWPSSVYNSIAERKTEGRLFTVGRKTQYIGYAPQILPYLITPINPIHIFLFLEERNLINRTGFPVHPLETGLTDVSTTPPTSSKNMQSLFGIKSSMNNRNFPFYMWYDDQASPQGREMKRTLSVLCRWFVYYFRHSSHPYGTYFLHSSRIPFAGCPMDRCLSLPIPEKRKKLQDYAKTLFVVKNRIPYYFPNLPATSESKLLNNPNLIFDKNGTPPSIMEISNNSLALVWTRFTAFTGCHGAAGILHWMLRSLNIPSEIVPIYQSDGGNAANPNANGDHKGIVVFVPKDSLSSSDTELCLFHLDEIFAIIKSFDPLIDPLNCFVDRKTFDRWFSPPLRPHTVVNDFDFFSNMLAMKYIYGRYPALSVKDGVESVLRDHYDLYDGKTFLTQGGYGQKEFKELRNQLSQILALRKKQIENDLYLPLGFNGATYYADWLNFALNRYQYITNTIGIFAEDPIKETKII